MGPHVAGVLVLKTRQKQTFRNDSLVLKVRDDEMSPADARHMQLPITLRLRAYSLSRA